MSEPLRCGASALPLELEREVDRICDDFEESLKDGVLPDLADYLERVPEAAQAQLLDELVKLLQTYAVVNQQLLHTARPHGDSSVGPGETPESASASGAGSDALGERRKLGEFELLEVIGRGGMGVVYRGYQPSMRRTLAIKLLSTDTKTESRRRELLNRFRREALAAAQLQHPNIVTVYEVGEFEGQPFYAMQLVEGQSLAQLVANQPLDGRRAARYMLAVAKAVDDMHRSGILHRDLKPSNILIDQARDLPLVADFGLAKLLAPEHAQTLSGECFGSPPYMPPEQIRDARAVGVTSDVYGLGATLYHLITGRPPFVAATIAATLQQVLSADPLEPQELNPSIDRDLSTVCMKCLDKEGSRRYASAAHLAADLERYLKHEPVTARPIGRLGKLLRWGRRNRLAASLGSIALGCLLVGSVTSTALYLRALAAAELATTQLSQLCLSSATAVERQGTAVPWLTQALQLDDSNPAREAADRIRLAALLEKSPRLEAMSFHQDQVVAVDVTSDGRYALSAGHDGKAQLSSLNDGSLVATITHGSAIVFAGFDPPGQRIATAGTDGILRLWQVPSGACLGEIVQVQGSRFGTFSQDGSLIATTGTQGTVCIWKTNGAVPVCTIENGTEVGSFEFDPGGTWVAIVAGQRVMLCDLPTGQRRCVMPHSGNVLAMQRSEDSEHLETIDDTGRLHRLAIADGKLLKSQPLPHADSLALARFSPDRRQLATATVSGAVTLWNVATCEIEQALENTERCRGLAYSANAARLLATCADSTVRVWDVPSGQPLSMPLAHAGSVEAAAFTVDGQRVVTGARDCAARVWKLPLVAAETVPHGKTELRDCSLSKDGTRLLLAGQAGAARIVDLVSLQCTDLPLQEQVESARFSGDLAEVWTGCMGGSVRRWSCVGPTVVSEFDHQNRLWDLAVNPQHSLLATAGEGGSIHVWNASTRKQVFKLPAPHRLARWIDFSNDGRYLAATGGPTASLWAVEGTQLRSLLTKHLGGNITSAAFDARSTRLLATSGVGELFVYDLPAGPARHLKTGTMPMCSAFSPNASRLIVGRNDGRAEVHEVATGRVTSLAGLHKGRVADACFDATGTTCATVGLDGWLYVLSAENGELIRSESTGKPLFRVFFARGGDCIVAASQSGDVTIWTHGIVTNTAHELEGYGQLLSGRRVEMAQGLIPLTPRELQQQWRNFGGVRVKHAPRL